MQESQPAFVKLLFMRLLYLLNFVSLAFDNWAIIIKGDGDLSTLEGVAISFWASFALLSLVGIRHPLKLLPILLLQLLYKSLWIIGIYWPAFQKEMVPESTTEFFYICIAGIVLNILIIPWKYFYQE